MWLAVLVIAGACTAGVDQIVGPSRGLGAVAHAVAQPSASGVVISQVYGGGGNVGATYKSDFVELYNASPNDVSLAGWSVQYASAAGTSWQVTNLTGTIASGHYYLVQEATGAGGTVALPTPDVTGTIAMSATAGKVALVGSTTALAATSGCPFPASVVDFVGFGTTANCFEGNAPTGAPAATTAAIRKGGGTTDAGENSTDFSIAAPTPRNSASAGGGVITVGPLDHIAVTGGAATVTPGATTQFTATGQDAANRTVTPIVITWASSDPAVASVDNTGKVTGVAASATPVTLTVTGVANGITKTATKSITVPLPAPAATVTVTPATPSVKAGKTVQLTAAAVDANGVATTTTFTWDSSDPAIATVDANGLVTGKTIGSATITATSANGTKGISAVTVTSAANVTITTGKTSLAYAMQTQFFFGGTDATGNAITSVVWSTSNPAILTVDQKGIITGTGLGTANLIATAPDGSFGSRAITIYLAAGTTGVRLGHNEEFGEPLDADQSNDIIIARDQYTVSYNPARGGANWVSWNLDATHVGANGRCPGTCYSADTALTRRGITAYTTADWVSGNTYDRGHMAPSADWTSSEADNNTTFFLTNFLPQRHDMNAGPWERLENALRDSVAGGREAYIIAGGIFGNGGAGLGTILNLGKIAIPNSTWKIAVITPAGTGINGDGTLPPNSTVLAVDMPNVTGILGDPFEKYLTTVDKIQQATGYDFLALLADSVECRVEVRNCAPVARIAGSGLTGGMEGQSLLFDASTSSDYDHDVLTYAWSIAGQPVGSAAALSYTFATHGSYQLHLVVNDGKGGMDSTTTTVTVGDVAPSVNALADGSVNEGSVYSATGSFADPGANRWNGIVDYGDGSGAQPLAVAPDKSFSLSHLYTTKGQHTLTVSVSDADLPGSTSSRSAAVTVLNVPPVVNAFAGGTVYRGSPYAAAGSFADPGDEQWGATVDYGDGTGAQPLTLAADKSFSLGHVYTKAGSYTVTVRVTEADADAGTSASSATVVVQNVPPTVSSFAGATLNEGGSYSATGSASGPAGDHLTATVDYGDGTGAQALTLAADGSFNLGHAYGRPGSYVVTVRVSDTDADGISTSASATVSVQNVAPVVSTIADGSINEGSRYTATGSFADPGTESWNAVVDFGDGTGAQPLALAADKSFALNHLYARKGQYTVTVRVSDSDAATGSSTATVTVLNVAPVVNAFAGAQINEGGSYSANGSFADPGDESWTATVDYGDASGVQPLTLVGKSFTLSHRYAQNGSYTVRVVVSESDAEHASGTQVATVSVANVAPSVSALPSATILRGESWSAAGTFTDPGTADVFSATVNFGDGTGTNALALSGGGFSLQHAFTTSGIQTVVVKVSDADGGTGTSSAQVTVLSAGAGVSQLQSMVSALAQAGKLDDGDAKWISNKLDIAAKEFAKGNTRPALNQLEQILNRIEAARAAGRLSGADAATLSDYTRRVIAAA